LRSKSQLSKFLGVHAGDAINFNIINEMLMNRYPIKSQFAFSKHEAVLIIAKI